MKKKTEQQLKELTRKRCVKLAKEISKQRDNYRCCYCGVGKPQRQVHSHHIFHEGIYKSMSADIDNLITMCVIHHQGGFGWKSPTGWNMHNSPRESTEWLMEKYPERYKKLKKQSQQSIVCDMQFWKKKLAELRT